MRIKKKPMTSELKDKTARGLLWGFVSSSSMQVLNVVFGIVLTFCLDSEDYGMMAVLSIYSAIAASLQDSGFVAALTNKPHPTHRDYNSVFWFNISCSAAIYIILWFAAPLIAAYNHDPRLIPLSRYTFAGFFVASFSITPRAILFKQMRVREQAITSLVALISSGLVGITMALCKMAFWSIATQSIVFVGVTTLLSWHFSHWRPSLTVSLQPIRQMLPFSIKLLITNVFSNINKFAFESVLGRFYPKSDIGFYSQANKWNLMGSQTIGGMVQSVAQPMFVEVGTDTQRQQRVLLKMLTFTAFVAFPALFGLSLVSHQLISLLPERWIPAADYLGLLAIGGAFIPLSALYSNFIIAQGKSDIYMWNTIAQSTIILLNIFSVQYFHLHIFHLSGIWLMMVIYIVVNILWIPVWHIFVYRQIHLTPLSALRAILPPMLTAAVAMIATHYATAPFITNQLVMLFIRIVLAAALYIGILRLTRSAILTECLDYVRHRTVRNV